jgi:hypothetical protein
LAGTRWKLIETSIYKNSQQHEITDYSAQNIIYEFQENGKLVVSGVIDDSLGLFNDFSEGEHFYEYRRLLMCPTCLPGKNFALNRPLDEPFNENGCYFLLYFCDGPMKVRGGGPMEFETAWEKTFIKLK